MHKPRTQSKQSLGGRKRRQRCSDQLLQTLRDFRRVAIVMHDNPDPDAIASGWAIKTLIEARLGYPTRLIGGGAIVRAENRHMIKLLQPPLELMDDYEADQETAIILVDCGPEATNHLVSGDLVSPVAVIDHHDPQLLTSIPHTDIRPHVAASATIVTAYLREQGLEPDQKLATALIYAIRTETRGCETRYSKLDRRVLPWLTKRADPSILAEIEDAPLPVDYFGDLVLALQNTFVYDDACFCMLPRAQGPEIVGEVADLLIRCEGVRRAICVAVFEQQVLLSARTDHDGENATQLLTKTLGPLGHCGGHRHRAGGKLLASTTASKVSEDLQEKLRGRWLDACGIKRQRGKRLVAKSEIVDNL